MNLELLTKLGGGGIAGALLLLIYIVGMRIVAALDRVAAKFDDHTKTDVAHHNEVKAEVRALAGRIDTQKAVEAAVERVADEVTGNHELAPPNGEPDELVLDPPIPFAKPRKPR